LLIGSGSNRSLRQNHSKGDQNPDTSVEGKKTLGKKRCARVFHREMKTIRPGGRAGAHKREFCFLHERQLKRARYKLCANTLMNGDNPIKKGSQDVLSGVDTVRIGKVTRAPFHPKKRKKERAGFHTTKRMGKRLMEQKKVLCQAEEDPKKGGPF